MLAAQLGERAWGQGVRRKEPGKMVVGADAVAGMDDSDAAFFGEITIDEVAAEMRMEVVAEKLSLGGVAVADLETPAAAADDLGTQVVVVDFGM